MKHRVVSIHYELKNKTGEVLDSSKGGDPLTYIEGQGHIISGLEKALVGLKVGDRQKVTVLAAEAYGTYDIRLKFAIPADKFPQDEKIEVGDQFRMKTDSEEPRIFTVMEVQKDKITVDGNHPLAGEDLYFDVEIAQAREATEDDLAHANCDHDHDHDDDHGHGHQH